jgi:hypothetical protein
VSALINFGSLSHLHILYCLHDRRGSQAARYERSFVKPLVRKFKAISNVDVLNTYLGTSTDIFENSYIILIIAVVINMFRLSYSLTSTIVVCNSLKLL